MLRWTALVIFIVIIGGVGSPAGPIFGVLGFWLIDEQLGDADAWRFIILGIIAMVMAVLAPKGIDGLLQRLRPTQLFPLQRRLELGVAADDSGGGGGSAVAASTGTASE